VAKRKVVPPWAHVGNEVPRDSPIRCEISYKRPEQVMRCIYASGHLGAHMYGNLQKVDQRQANCACIGMDRDDGLHERNCPAFTNAQRETK
jgi:hypothetical protein